MSDATTVAPVTEAPTEPLAGALHVDSKRVHGYLDEKVRGTVEETLNALHDAEADELCGAKKYERTPDRVDTRAGSYARSLETKAGKVKLQVPKLRKLPFETQIIERHKRRETSVEEALVERADLGSELQTPFTGQPSPSKAIFTRSRGDAEERQRKAACNQNRNHFGVGAGSAINADANTLDAETQATALGVLGTTRRFRESDGLNVACIPEESPVSRRRIQGIYSRGAAGFAEGRRKRWRETPRDLMR